MVAPAAPPPKPAPAAAPPKLAPVVQAPPAPKAVADPVQERILALVVEKTGYPREMLDLDLDLEADLGVDTVKQAEMFAAIRETYDIPRDPNLKLRDFPTLAHIIRFARERQPAAIAPPAPVAAAPAAAPATAAPAAAAPATDPIQERILALVVEKTGYPRDMLDLDLDLEADLGVDTVKQAEMFAAIREAYGIARDPNLKLRDFPTLAHIIRFAKERQPAAVASPAPAPAPLAADAIQERILDLVVEKTGYPKEMLDLDLDLEADLGVDTVKQAEMFAAIRETYDIPRDPNLKLRDFPTLAHIIRFAQGAAARRRRRSAGRGCRRRRAARRRSHPGAHPRPRRRKDRLPEGNAGPRSRPGSRPRCGHRQAGRDVRRDPRGVRHPARSKPEAARFSDAGACHSIRHGARGGGIGAGRRACAAQPPRSPPSKRLRPFRAACPFRRSVRRSACASRPA